MIAYFFPPLGGIASLRALRFARGLPEHGWEPLVIAPRSGDYPRDPTLVYPETGVVRTPSLEVSRTGRGAVRQLVRGASLSGSSALDRAKDLVRRWLYLPDPQVGWYPFAVAAARRAVREQRVDAVFSSAYPMTAHIVARRLHRDTGLPWVADYRDLWTDWSSASGWRRRADLGLERKALEEATAVVTVSPTYAEVLRSRGAREAEVITNGFDPEVLPATDEVTDVLCAHLGTYYPGVQDLGAALQAVGELARGGEVPDARVRFIGDLPLSLRAWLESASLLAHVEATGWLPHGEAVRQLRRAQVLLLPGPVSNETAALRGHIVAKVFECLGSGRPILMVGHQDTDVGRILAPFSRARIVAPGDVPGARRALQELSRWKPAGGEPSLEPYTARALARRLAALLDRVTS
jgi:hypothetical protein